jgi:hypothetical protein
VGNNSIFLIEKYKENTFFSETNPELFFSEIIEKNNTNTNSNYANTNANSNNANTNDNANGILSSHFNFKKLIFNTKTLYKTSKEIFAVVKNEKRNGYDYDFISIHSISNYFVNIYKKYSENAKEILYSESIKYVLSNSKKEIDFNKVYYYIIFR